MYGTMAQNQVWTGSQPRVRGRQSRSESSLRRMAAARFNRAQFRAQIGRLVALFSGRAYRLLHLGSVETRARLRSGRYLGVRSVPIRQIRGSEGRSGDFDAHFRPLKAHSKSRWVGLATAWQQGVVLPPVELIQVGDIYFVRDGHHRISVARAFDQEHIDAVVTVWDVVGPLPREPKPATEQVAWQPV